MMAGCSKNDNIRPAGCSDDEMESDDDIDTFRFFATVKKGKKKRSNTSCNVSSCVYQRPQDSLPSAYSSQPKLSYWEKKKRAFEKFGEADVRPQQNYRPFLLHRRQLNNGSKNEMWKVNKKSEEIQNEMYPFEILEINLPKYVPPALFVNSLEVVETPESFALMMAHLWNMKEVAIDLEGNSEHSYLGMTVMIQIGTKDIDFIINVFPVHDLIMTELKAFLEESSCMKYFCGADNDVLWLKRDYFIDVTRIVDMQILFQVVLKKGLFDEVTRTLPRNQVIAWYRKYVGQRYKDTPEVNRLSWEAEAGENPMSFEKITELFYPNTCIDKDAQVADFRPRKDGNTELYQSLVEYARGDVHIMLRIIVSIKSLLNPDARKDVFTTAHAMSKYKVNTTFKPMKNQNSEEYLQSKNAVEVATPLQSRFKMVYDWRNLHAKIIDESPKSMFSEVQILELLKNPPTSMEELDNIFSVKRGREQKRVSPESLETWKKPLFSLLHESTAEVFWKKLWELECHNCGLCEGHLGWGCPLPWSVAATKLSVKSNPISNRNQNNRRQRNKRANKKARKAAEEAEDESYNF